MLERCGRFANERVGYVEDSVDAAHETSRIAGMVVVEHACLEVAVRRRLTGVRGAANHLAIHRDFFTEHGELALSSSRERGPRVVDERQASHRHTCSGASEKTNS